MSLYLLFPLLWGIVTVTGALALRRKNIDIDKNAEIGLLCLTLLVCLAIRVYFALQDLWFKDDITAFKMWTDCARQNGIYGFYKNVWCDYTPGYVYVFYLIGLLKNAFEVTSETFYVFLIKMPNIIADLATVVFVWYMAKKRRGVGIISLFRAFAYGMCPAVIYNSRIWGQVDSVWVFFLILAIFFLGEEKAVPAALSYAAALLLKPHRLMFGRVFLFWMLKKKDFKRIFKALVVGLSRVFIASFPFTRSLNPLWIVRLYFRTMGSYNDFSVNGFNLWYLLGLNNVSTSGFKFAWLINPAVIALCFLTVAVGCCKMRNKENLWLISFINIAIIFAFCTSMHERYIFPAIVLAMLAFVAEKSRSFIILTAGYGMATYINLIYVMGVSNLIDYQIPDTVSILSSGVMVAITAFAILVYYVKCFSRKHWV